MHLRKAKKSLKAIRGNSENSGKLTLYENINDPLNDNWKLPVEFSKEDPRTVQRYWYSIVKQTTKRYGPYMYTADVELVVAQIGFYNSMRTLAFMSLPISKYFEYPFSPRKITEGYKELCERVNDKSKQRSYTGFIGHAVHILDTEINNNGTESS